MKTRASLHATAVDYEGKSAVILGKSGSGKSTLALRMIALGAVLVGDDKITVTSENENLYANSMSSVSGKIEIRGVGILNTPHISKSEVQFFVDMDTIEDQRLPPFRKIAILDQNATLYHRIEGDHFAEALMQILKYGRSD